jgi:hypothetical protein
MANDQSPHQGLSTRWDLPSRHLGASNSKISMGKQSWSISIFLKGIRTPKLAYAYDLVDQQLTFWFCASVTAMGYQAPGQLGGWGWSHPFTVISTFSSGPSIFLYEMPDLSLQNGLPRLLSAEAVPSLLLFWAAPLVCPGRRASDDLVTMDHLKIANMLWTKI